MFKVNVREIRAKGGATLALDGSQPTKGFAVAIDGHEWEAPDIISDSTFGKLLDAYISVFGYLFDNPHRHIGIWHDTNEHRFVFDISEIYSDLSDAVRIATEREQRAIYDLSDEVEIPVAQASGILV